jgi:hypothetical protein
MFGNYVPTKKCRRIHVSAGEKKSAEKIEKKRVTSPSYAKN